MCYLFRNLEWFSMSLKPYKLWDQQEHVQYGNNYMPYVLIVCSYKLGAFLTIQIPIKYVWHSALQLR